MSREEFVAELRQEALRLSEPVGNQRRGFERAISVETVRLIEEGKTIDPRARLLGVMARVLGMTVEELLYGTAPAPSKPSPQLASAASQLRIIAAEIEQTAQINFGSLPKS